MFVRKTSARDKHLSSKRVVWTKQLEEWWRRRRFTPIYQCSIGIDSRLSAMADNFVKRMTSYLPFVNSPWTTNKMARYFTHTYVHYIQEVLSLPHAFQLDSSGFYRIPPDSTGLHQTQCLVGHHTKFPDWTGFSVQWSLVESTGLGPVRLYQTESPVKSSGIHWILPELIC